jgi:hypothetical protein
MNSKFLRALMASMATVLPFFFFFFFYYFLCWWVLVVDLSMDVSRVVVVNTFWSPWNVRMSLCPLSGGGGCRK